MLINSKKHIIKKLDKIPLRKKVIIKNINLESPNMIRLMEMGIIPGEEVQILRKAPLGDPLEISIMGYNLCIRKSEAQNIEVEYEEHS